MSDQVERISVKENVSHFKAPWNIPKNLIGNFSSYAASLRQESSP